MAVSRCLKSTFLALAASLTMTAEAHGQGGAGQPKVIPPSKNDRWMTEMAAAYPSYGQLQLGQALFAGAHDAGAYSLMDVFSPDQPYLALLQLLPASPLALVLPTIKGWSTTQSGDLASQLQGGVRYFDLRLCAPLVSGQPVRFCHGLYGPTLEDGLTQIDNFLAQPGRSKEIVILSFAIWGGFAQGDSIDTATKQTIRNKIGNRMFPIPGEAAQATLQDVWNSGKQVIAMYPVDDTDGFWSTGWQRGAWPNQIDIPLLKDQVARNLSCRCSHPSGTAARANGFFSLETQATPDVVAMILDLQYASRHPYGSLAGLAAASNPVVLPAVLGRANANLNIVVSDYTTDSGLVEALKNLTVARLDLIEHTIPRRAYLSRTESPDPVAAAVTTSWNGTHFAQQKRISDTNVAGSAAIGPGFPAIASIGRTLFAGDMRVTSISDDFMEVDREWGNGPGNFAVDLNEGLPPDISGPASYAEAYGRLYVAWLDLLTGELKFRSSAGGHTFPESDKRATGFRTAGIPVLASHMGILYVAWISADSSRRLEHAAIARDGSFTYLGMLASGLQVRPALTGFKDQLIFAWSDESDRRIRLLRVTPATGEQSDVITLSDTTASAPSLAVFKGSVILAYTGEDARRYTLVSADGVSFPAADRARQEPAFPSHLNPPTLHAWGDRAIVTIESRKKADGTTYVPFTWTNQSVTVTFTCEAPVAGVYGFVVDTVPGPGEFVAGSSVSVTINETGLQTTQVDCVDLSGYRVPRAVATMIDRTPPTVVYQSSTSEQPPSSGWYRTDVVSTFECTDAQSGAREPEVSSTLSGEGRDLVAIGTCFDMAGNSGTSGSGSTRFNIDKTKPVLDVPANFSIRSPHAPFPVTFPTPVTPNDALSGVFSVSCDHVSGSLFPAGTTRVTCTATDNAGNTATKSFEVTVTVNAPPAIAGVSGGPVAEGSSVAVTVSANDDGGAAALRYEFDCDADGTFEVGPQGAATATCAFADSGARTIKVRVIDEDGAATLSSGTVTVNNVAPSATFAHNGPVDEGASFTLGMTGATDPSPADTAAGFQYAFDCGAGYGAFSTQASATCPAGGSGTLNVRGKVRDKDGGERESLATMTVNGVPPVITVPAAMTVQATGPNGAVVTFDASALDALDGSVPADCSPASGSTFPLGTKPVSCTAVDKRGNKADPVSFTVTVHDTIAPVVSYSGNAGSYGPDQVVDIRCTATDSASGVASTTCADVNGPAYSFALGTNTFSATATDRAGNIGGGSTSFTVGTSGDAVKALVTRFSTNAGVANGLNAKITAACKAPNANARAGELGAFANQLRAQTGKALTPEQAAILLRLVAAL